VDETIIKTYRRLLQAGFQNAGSFENPSIFLDSIGENLPICDVAGRDYLKIYICVTDGVINDIKYLCNCDPTANVVIETLCDLVKGMTLDEAGALSPEMFFRKIGSRGETVAKKVGGIIELLKRGIQRFEAGVTCA
jgi:NifU-like protein involved in Fe-S cluster formation